MNNGIIRCRTPEVECIGPLFVGVGESSSGVAASAAAASANPVFGGRSHHDQPEEFGIGGHGEFSAAVGSGGRIAVNAGAVILMGNEAVTPTRFFEVVCAETLRAGNAFELERHFGVSG